MADTIPYYTFDQLILSNPDNHRYRLIRISYPPGRGYMEHILGYYGFFLILSGTMRYRLNGQERMLRRGTLQIIFPGDRHSIDSVDEHDELVFINCDITVEEMLKNFHFLIDHYACKLTDCVQTVTGLSDWQWRMLCDSSLRLIGFGNSKKKESLAETALWHTLLQNVLNLLIQRSSPDESGGQPVWLERAFHRMLERENYLAGVPRFLELCGRSHEHICRAMRNCYGITPQQFVTNLRLEYAAEQLWNSRSSITEIAFHSGFNNLAYFRKCFERKFQITPRGYRQRRENFSPRQTE